MPGNFNSPQIDFAGALANMGNSIGQMADQRNLQNTFAKFNGHNWDEISKALIAGGHVKEGLQAYEIGAKNGPSWKVNPGDNSYYDANSPTNPGQNSGQPGPVISPAQKTEDATFGKTIPDWESGGRAEETQSLGALDEALGNLNASMQPGGTPVSGPTPGALGWIGQHVPGVAESYATMGQMIKDHPGYATANYPKAVATMNSHVRAVAGGMKAILGGQRAQAVVQQIIGATYNADLPPEENIARLKRLRANIETAGKAKEAQIAWFKSHNGSLVGYTGPNPEAIVGGAVSEFQSASSPDAGGQSLQDGQTIYDPDGNAHIVRNGQIVPYDQQ